MTPEEHAQAEREDAAAGQARIDAWWGDRDREYRSRPEVAEEIGRNQAETHRRWAAEDAYAGRLEERAAAGEPGAQQELDEEMTRQSVDSLPPPEPSAKDDPDQWRAFYREFEGQDWPLNADYQAARHRVEAAAPPDVGGLAAEYFESNDLSGQYPDDELTAERCGITVDQLWAERHADELEVD